MLFALLPTDRDNPSAPVEHVATYEAHRHEVDERLSDLDFAVQANTQQLNDITTVLNDIRQRMGPDRLAVASASTAILSGNDLLFVLDGVLSRWPWVDPSIVEDISNGKFNIYDLPKWHCDEYLRNKHIAKSVDSVVHPLSSGRPHMVQAKTKLQSSLKDFGTFLSAWMVYVSIRSIFEPECGLGLAI